MMAFHLREEVIMATALEKYVDSKNLWERLTKKPERPVPTTPEECEHFFNALECDLSPENLCCDGEISMAAVRSKSRQYNAAWKQLEKIAGKREQNI
jgi:hypothetical protein